MRDPINVTEAVDLLRDLAGELRGVTICRESLQSALEAGATRVPELDALDEWAALLDRAHYLLDARLRVGPPGEPTVERLWTAVRNTLDRAQIDPDLGYLVGPHGALFEALCHAEAAYLGEDVEATKGRRGRDGQPEHARREPEVVELRRRVRQLEDRLLDLGEEVDHGR